jgi:hypothetical protein
MVGICVSDAQKGARSSQVYLSPCSDVQYAFQSDQAVTWMTVVEDKLMPENRRS